MSGVSYITTPGALERPVRPRNVHQHPRDPIPHTIIFRGRSRVLKLRIFGLRLVDELLLVLPLVLVVSGFLARGDGSLVRKAEEHAKGEG